MPSRAFTLIELLVVISIIALLIGILLPALGKAKAEGWKTQCLSNLRGLGTSLQLYFNDSDGVLPWIDLIAGADENENSIDLFDVLDAYIDAPRPYREDPDDLESHNWIVELPYRCPADRGGLDAENPDPAYRTWGLSYMMVASEIYFGLEALNAIDPDNADPAIAAQEKWKGQRAVSRTYDQFANRGRKLAVIRDFDRFHLSSNADGRNALYWDGSADIYPGDPPPEFSEAFLANVLKLCNFGM